MKMVFLFMSRRDPGCCYHRRSENASCQGGCILRNKFVPEVNMGNTWIPAHK